MPWNKEGFRPHQITLGKIVTNSKLLLAPMADITDRSFRLLMQDLGAGATVSELISCHGINYGSINTLKMLGLDPREKNVGIQLFGEEPQALAQAIELVQNQIKPHFIDLNMGCPVKKVVSKGAGAALLKDLKKIEKILETCCAIARLPLSIKIRLGWDEQNLVAEEVLKITSQYPISFVTLHGRTRSQQYGGSNNWDYIESLAAKKYLPLVGNGDLHSTQQVRNRLAHTNCQALMLGRGPLRNPFIFQQSLTEIKISGEDYWQVVKKLHDYLSEHLDCPRKILIRLQKHIIWFCHGMSNSSQLRKNIFSCTHISDTMKLAQDYFCSQGEIP